MSVTQVGKHKVVGLKQTRRAVNDGAAKAVYLAADAQEHLTAPLKALCEQAGIEVVVVETMRTLGETFGIDVGSCAAAVLKDPS